MGMKWNHEALCLTRVGSQSRIPPSQPSARLARTYPAARFSHLAAHVPKKKIQPSARSTPNRATLYYILLTYLTRNNEILCMYVCTYMGIRCRGWGADDDVGVVAVFSRFRVSQASQRFEHCICMYIVLLHHAWLHCQLAHCQHFVPCCTK